MKNIFAGSLIALTLALPASMVASSSADAIGIRVGPGGVGVRLGGPVVRRRPLVRRAPVVVAPRVVRPLRARPLRRGPAVIIR